MIPYGRQEILEEDIQAVVQALRSDLITTGPLVDEFERLLSDYVKCPTFVVNSGTAALHAAYFGIGIGPGDEVITPPNTFIATQATAALLGAKIVFADIDLETGLIDLECIERAITNRTKAIVLVDYAGQPCDVKAVREIIGGRDIKIVQDAAHSLGSFINGEPVGSQADVTTFSFFATKNITTGEGGAVSSPDKVIFQRAKEFARQGLVKDPSRFKNSPPGPWHQEVHEFGLNYRLTDFQCALGISQLGKIDEFKSKRNKLYDTYTEKLTNFKGIRLLKKLDGRDPMWHLFPIFVENRNEVISELRNKGIIAQVNYIAAYLHPVFTNLGYKIGTCPNSESFYSQEISLPLHLSLNQSSVEEICALLKNLVESDLKSR
jgi:dTDP-4-amino-4,6-dideoxygalactose transaminase